MDPVGQPEPAGDPNVDMANHDGGSQQREREPSREDSPMSGADRLERPGKLHGESPELSLFLAQESLSDSGSPKFSRSSPLDDGEAQSEENEHQHDQPPQDADRQSPGDSRESPLFVDDDEPFPEPGYPRFSRLSPIESEYDEDEHEGVWPGQPNYDSEPGENGGPEEAGDSDADRAPEDGSDLGDDDDSHAGSQDGYDGSDAGENDNAWKGPAPSQERGSTAKERILKMKITRLEQEAVTRNAIIRQEKAEIRRLRQLLTSHSINPDTGVARSRPDADSRIRKAHVRSWPGLVREFMRGVQKGSMWTEICKQSNKEENMSVNHDALHPAIRFRGPTDEEASDDDSDDGIGSVGPAPVFCDPRANFIHRYQNVRCSFDNLPDSVVLKILQELLEFPGCLIHVFSRLDPFTPTRVSPNPASSGLKGRFYITAAGSTSDTICLTEDTVDPSVLLGPLSINRQWNFFAVNVFYGRNTFALSSFGELDRFMAGLGPRRQRLRHLEIHWQGSTSIRWTDEEDDIQGPAKFQNLGQGRGNIIVGERTDVRSQKDESRAPLAWLDQDKMPSLQTLVIWMDESSKARIARPFEPLDEIIHAAQATAGQPHTRISRALRVCRGWAWLHALRGLEWLRIYDTQKYLAFRDRDRSVVSDLSAVYDLNRTCRMAKTKWHAEQALVQNLESLWPPHVDKWLPGREAYALVEGDTYALRPNDLDQDPAFERSIASSSEAGSDISSDTGDEGSEDASNNGSVDSGDNSDDGDGAALLTPVSFGRPFHRNSTPAPSHAASSADSDDDSDGDDKPEQPEVKVGEASIRQQRTRQFVQAHAVNGPVDLTGGRRARSQGAQAQINRLSEPLLRAVRDRTPVAGSAASVVIEIDDSDDDDDDEHSQNERSPSAATSKPTPTSDPANPVISGMRQDRRSTSSGMFVSNSTNGSRSSLTASLLAAIPGAAPDATPRATPRAASEGFPRAVSVVIDLTNDDEDVDAQSPPAHVSTPIPVESHPRGSVKRSASPTKLDDETQAKKRRTDLERLEWDWENGHESI